MTGQDRTGQEYLGKIFSSRMLMAAQGLFKEPALNKQRMMITDLIYSPSPLLI
jgi:hypothetical protein